MTAQANPKTLLLLKPRGFCAGVVRAIDIVRIALDAFGAPIYVRKEIVHNRHVVDELSSKGAIFVDSVDEVPNGERVIYSAHGVAPEVRDASKARGLRVIDATCPLVTKVHVEAVKQVASEADSLLVVGSDSSSNSNRLVEVARNLGRSSHLIENIRSIQPEWLEGVDTIALTAGASAPEILVEQAIDFLRDKGFTKLEEVEVMPENVRFGLPPEIVAAIASAPAATAGD